MDWSTVVIAWALAMDAFAVSVTNGIPIYRLRRQHVLRFALYFGCFQGGMTALGYGVGSSLSPVFLAYDHWIAFGLLAFIGGKMLYDAKDHTPGESQTNAFTDPRTMIILSIATSIDALAAGIGLSLVSQNIWLTVGAVTLVTAFLSGLGVYLGYRIGRLFERIATLLGGVLLIGMGFKILIEHLIQGI